MIHTQDMLHIIYTYTAAGNIGRLLSSAVINIQNLD